MKTDEELIAEAVAQGRVRIIPRGATSEWDNMSYKQRRTIITKANMCNKKGRDQNHD